jgi:methionyl-tRNA formyltransferase
MKLAFFGTDHFSVEVLERLGAAGISPSLIVCAPDRPAGRGMEMREPDAKVWAKRQGVPVRQPEKLDTAFVGELAAAGPWDAVAVASYGKIIPQAVLDVPANGCLNVHPSLLPRHRGATPIETAMLADEKATGVTVILMDAKMDHGPIVAAAPVTFDEWPTRPEVERLTAKIGGDLLAEILPKWLEGSAVAAPQDEAAATYTTMLQKAAGDLSSATTEREKFLRVQAMAPWPGAFMVVTAKNGLPVRVKILSAQWDAENSRCVFEKVVPEGKGAMDWASFENGFLR